MLDVHTYLIDDDDIPLRLARPRYAACLRGRFPIPRLAARTARIAHVLFDHSATRRWVDERYPLVRFDARGLALGDDDFLELCTAAVGLRVPAGEESPPVLVVRPRATSRRWKPTMAQRNNLVAEIVGDPTGGERAA